MKEKIEITTKEKETERFWMAKFALVETIGLQDSDYQKFHKNLEHELSALHIKFLLKLGQLAKPWEIALHAVFLNLINRSYSTGEEILQLAENLNERGLSNFYYGRRILENKFEKYDTEKLLELVGKTKHDFIRSDIKKLLAGRRDDLRKMAIY